MPLNSVSKVYCIFYPNCFRSSICSMTFNDYSFSVNKQLLEAGIRSEVDDRSEKIGKKIRDTELMRVPYMLVIGEKEQTEGCVSVRRQGKGDAGQCSVSEILSTLTSENKNRQSI